MRLELVGGHYLDVLANRTGLASMESALRLARLKSGNYTIGHPLRLGAIAGGAENKLLLGFGEFGGWLGEAFQIHDDIIGVDGSAETTGKPVGDDLREGKLTTLSMFHNGQGDGCGVQSAGRAARVLDLSEHDIGESRQIIARCGALDAVRDLLADRADRALGVLAELPVGEAVKQPLRDLVDLCVGTAA
ncbi:polyprenyl synthetase family protein [Amycolatopsis sp. NPDC088138]|uniref:polyprenyl synthetase family protein n=1 Tax=Amycolatopsis sp. NPDC088138 TaxID=3363938 RepID=UPI00380117D0